MNSFYKTSEISKDEIYAGKTSRTLKAVEPSLTIGHINKVQLWEEKQMHVVVQVSC